MVDLTHDGRPRPSPTDQPEELTFHKGIDYAVVMRPLGTTVAPLARVYGIYAAKYGNLFAAAPDLLAALKACSDAFASWQAGQIPGRPEAILALIQMTRAAIAKAEGR